MRLIGYTFILFLILLCPPRISEAQQYTTSTAYVLEVQQVVESWTVVLLYKNQAYPVLVGPSRQRPYRQGEWIAVDVIQYHHGIQLRIRNPRTTR